MITFSPILSFFAEFEGKKSRYSLFVSLYVKPHTGREKTIAAERKVINLFSVKPQYSTVVIS